MISIAFLIQSVDPRPAGWETQPLRTTVGGNSDSRPSVTDEDYSGQYGGNCLNHGLIGLRGFHGLKMSDGWRTRKDGRTEGGKKGTESRFGDRSYHVSPVGGNSDSRPSVTDEDYSGRRGGL